MVRRCHGGALAQPLEVGTTGHAAAGVEQVRCREDQGVTWLLLAYWRIEIGLYSFDVGLMINDE